MNVSFRWLRALPVLTLLAAPLAAQDTPATAPVVIERSQAVSANPRISVRNVSGKVEIIAWDRNEVSIVAEKRARKPEVAAKAEIVIETSADRIDIETRFEKSWIWGDKVEVDYLIKAPAGARLDVKVVNAGVITQGITGPANVEAVNGNLDLAGLTAGGRFKTVNGSIDATFSAVAARDDITIETVNGNVDLSLPADATFSLTARTINGGMRCAFPLDKSKNSRTEVVGTVGSGGAAVTLKSVNGNLQVRKHTP
ncbi:MAG: DUF4097 domain-containing protein [Verrucomicrobia bacterium]|nr:DUF4097 domain-containing protein [Verrucomicrobiota bacterium]